MGTLLLRLMAPLQAWGDESKYDIRGTRTEPTKSGVIGMISAAMGYRRDSNKISELAGKLRMGIRVDQPGSIIRDFHTARPPQYGKDGMIKYNSDGTIKMEKNAYITQRYYISDACFLVGIECDDNELLSEIMNALKTPKFPLYLGRRSCPPSLPIIIGITSDTLESSLKQTEWKAAEWYKNKYKNIRARIITETPKGKNSWFNVMDQPVSFSPIHRKYTLRGLDREQYVLLGTPEHNPMEYL